MSICPIDYRLCDRTVTIYRKQGSQILRQVIENAYLQWHRQQRTEVMGRSNQQKFLLIVPGDAQNVFPGDWVVEGIGPEVSSWCDVTQNKAAGEVSYTEPYYWEGTLCHTEAGRK